MQFNICVYLSCVIVPVLCWTSSVCSFAFAHARDSTFQMLGFVCTLKIVFFVLCSFSSLVGYCPLLCALNATTIFNIIYFECVVVLPDRVATHLTRRVCFSCIIWFSSLHATPLFWTILALGVLLLFGSRCLLFGSVHFCVYASRKAFEFVANVLNFGILLNTIGFYMLAAFFAENKSKPISWFACWLLMLMRDSLILFGSNSRFTF